MLNFLEYIISIVGNIILTIFVFTGINQKIMECAA